MTLDKHSIVGPRATWLEHLLVHEWGASGVGLQAQVSSLHGQLDESVVRQLRTLIAVRNRVMHEHAYTLEDPEGFVRTYEQVARYLEIHSPKARSARPFPVETAAPPGRGSSPGCLLGTSLLAALFGLILWLTHVLNSCMLCGR